MRLRFAGDDRPMFGRTALECLRYHCHGDHSTEAIRGDIDGVMKRLAKMFAIDAYYTALSNLEERCSAFVELALANGVLIREGSQN